MKKNVVENNRPIIIDIISYILSILLTMMLAYMCTYPQYAL